MSGVVEQAERERGRRDLNAYLERLLEGDDITGAAAGVTRKVIAEGEESLVGNQVYVFEKNVRIPFLNIRCT